jgi:hypothetical protein
MEAKLLDACAVLLGPQARRAGQALLRQLTVATVRTAFRRLALRTHPDSANGPVDGAPFIEASRAYELLMAFLLARRRPEEIRRQSAYQGPSGSSGARPRPHASGQGPFTAGQRPHAAGPRAHSSGPTAGQRSYTGGPRPNAAGAHGARARADRARGTFYHGPLPRRRLRLAEFLYYSGSISWQSLIGALVWQRSGRPKFGEIARQLQLVSASDMTRVLLARVRHEPTGAAASRLRLITVEDVRRVLRIQRARQRPIGRYFVEKERMSDMELTRLLHELFRHNARCRLEAEKLNKAHAQKETVTA